MKRRFLLPLGLAAALLGACDGASPATSGAADEAIASTSEDLRACTTADLSWPDPNDNNVACEGPWEFQASCQQADAARCGRSTTQCDEYNTCWHKTEPQMVSVGYTTTIHMNKDCDIGPHNICMYDTASAGIECENTANARLAEARAAMPTTNLAPNANFVNEVRVFHSGSGSSSALGNGIYTCRVTITKPNVLLGADQACTCKTWHPNTCKVAGRFCNAPTARRFSAPGLTRAQITADSLDDAPTCTTCQGLTDATQLEECLEKSWNRLNLGDRDFEGSSTRAVTAPWQLEGSGGINVNDAGTSYSGHNNAWVWPAAGNWAAIKQTVPVTPGKTYTVQAALQTAPGMQDGYFGFRPAGTYSPISEVKFGPFPTYGTRSVSYTPGPGVFDVDVFAGMWSTANGMWLRIDAMWLSDGESIAADPLRAMLMRRAQRLYEMSGQTLDEGHLARLRHLAYGDWGAPELGVGCGNGDVVPNPPSCDDDEHYEVRLDLARCNRLLQDEVAPELVSRELFGCIDVLNRLTELRYTFPEDDVSCLGPEMRRMARDNTLRLFRKQTAVAGTSVQAKDSLGWMPRQLALFDAWYEAVRASVVAEGVADPDEAMSADLSNGLSILWDAAYGQREPFSALREAANRTTASTTERQQQQADVNRLLAGLTGKGYDVDQLIVAAAFTPLTTLEPDHRAVNRLPLTGQPLLRLLGEALTPMEEHADDLSVFHDFACSFRKGCGSVLVDTPVARAWQVLAGLGKKASLDVALTTTRRLSGWRETLGLVSAGHATLASALVAAGVTTAAGELTTTDIDALPRAARTLAQLMRKGAARHGAFVRTGQFEPKELHQLTAGLDVEARQTVINDVTSDVDVYNRTVTDYANGVVSFVAQLTGEVDAHGAWERVQNEKMLAAERHEQLGRDVVALERAGRAENERFNDLRSRFTAVAGQIDGGLFYVERTVPPLSIDGTSARWADAGDVRQWAASSIDGLARGKMLVASVSGTYQPSCALASVHLTSPDNGATKDIVPAGMGSGATARDAVCGPEGYALSFGNSTFTASGQNTASTDSQSVSASFELCAGTPGTVTEATGVSLKACLRQSFDHIHSDSETTASGTQNNTAATFAAGLRLTGTPFPAAPTGALLLVFANPQNGVVTETHVMTTGENSFIVPADGLVAYVVVNDDGRCTGDDTLHKLTVNTQVVVDAATRAQGVINAMAQVLVLMKQHDAEATAGARIMPNQSAAYRSEALALLDTFVDPDRCPPQARRLFDAFVDQEILRLERAVEIEQLSREMQQLTRQVETMNDEQRIADQASSLRSLASRWALRGLDGRKLRLSAVELLRVVRSEFMPILELWYPLTLESFGSSTALDRLLGDAELDTSVMDLAGSTRDVLNTMLTQFHDARRGYRGAGEIYPVVAVSIPNPAYVYRRGIFPSAYKKVDPAMAAQVWNAIASRGKARITLRPEDVYSELDGGLPCFEHNPVVEKLVLYAVRPGRPDDVELNAALRKLNSSASVIQMFATTLGPVVYKLTSAVWQQNALPLLYGEPDHITAAMAEDTDTRSQRPVGLSPFATYEVDFAKLSNLEGAGGVSGFDQYTSELLVVMSVDSKATGENLSWVEACRAPAAPPAPAPAPTPTPSTGGGTHTQPGDSPPIVPPRDQM